MSGDAEEKKAPPAEPAQLRHSWSFFFDDGTFGGSRSADYLKHMVCLGAFSSVQDFWCYYNTVEPTLERICKHGKFNLRLFKKGIQPIWEDPANQNGGKWVIKCPLDSLKLWFDLLLAVIGEQLPASDTVCGCVLAHRLRRRELQLWVQRDPSATDARAGGSESQPQPAADASKDSAAENGSVPAVSSPSSAIDAIAAEIRKVLRLDPGFQIEYCSHKAVMESGGSDAKRRMKKVSGQSRTWDAASVAAAAASIRAEAAAASSGSDSAAAGAATAAPGSTGPRPRQLNGRGHHPHSKSMSQPATPLPQHSRSAGSGASSVPAGAKSPMSPRRSPAKLIAAKSDGAVPSENLDADTPSSSGKGPRVRISPMPSPLSSPRAIISSGGGEESKQAVLPQRTPKSAMKQLPLLTIPPSRSMSGTSLASSASASASSSGASSPQPQPPSEDEILAAMKLSSNTTADEPPRSLSSSVPAAAVAVAAAAPAKPAPGGAASKQPAAQPPAQPHSGKQPSAAPKPAKAAASSAPAAASADLPALSAAERARVEAVQKQRAKGSSWTAGQSRSKKPARPQELVFEESPEGGTPAAMRSPQAAPRPAPSFSAAAGAGAAASSASPSGAAATASFAVRVTPAESKPSPRVQQQQQPHSPASDEQSDVVGELPSAQAAALTAAPLSEEDRARVLAVKQKRVQAQSWPYAAPTLAHYAGRQPQSLTLGKMYIPGAESRLQVPPPLTGSADGSVRVAASPLLGLHLRAASPSLSPHSPGSPPVEAESGAAAAIPSHHRRVSSGTAGITLGLGLRRGSGAGSGAGVSPPALSPAQLPRSLSPAVPAPVASPAAAPASAASAAAAAPAKAGPPAAAAASPAINGTPKGHVKRLSEAKSDAKAAAAAASADSKRAAAKPKENGVGKHSQPQPQPQQAKPKAEPKPAPVAAAPVAQSQAEAVAESEDAADSGAPASASAARGKGKKGRNARGKKAQPGPAQQPAAKSAPATANAATSANRSGGGGTDRKPLPTMAILGLLALVVLILVPTLAQVLPRAVRAEPADLLAGPLVEGFVSAAEPPLSDATHAAHASLQQPAVAAVSPLATATTVAAKNGAGRLAVDAAALLLMLSSGLIGQAVAFQEA